MRVLDLFSGIGGFSLGLERAGMTTVAFCEVDPFCRAVLKKHWPKVPVYDDVQTLNATRLATDGIRVDVICGGFPCQDISIAGKGAGLAGKRSGLWWHFHRLIKEIRPSWVVIENVSALRSKGLDDVLRSLAEIGYDAEWHCIPASAVGAPHRRDRIWIVAYPAQLQRHGGDDNSRVGLGCQTISEFRDDGWPKNVADTDRPRLEGWLRRILQECASQFISGAVSTYGVESVWSVEPNVGRVANGVSARVDRLKALGNAVVPQIPEIIAGAIMAYEQSAND